VVAPAATVTDAGVVSAVLLSDSVTAVPPVGAAAEIVTVQLVLPPDATDVGVHASPVTVVADVVAGGVTVTDAVPELPFNEAVIVAVWFDATVPAVPVKLPVVAPAATVTDDGTVRPVQLLDTVTAVPPVGAAAEIVTLQLVLPPDATDVGVHVSPVTVVAAGGVTVTEAVPELPFNDAVIVTAWFDVTVPAVPVKLPVVAPAATVTDAGVVSAVLLSDTVTAVPPVGAAAEIVTVQLVLAPDTTEVGVHVSPVTVGAGGVTVTDAVPELPFNDAVIVAVWFDATVPAVPVKLPVVAPAATVTVAGVVSAVLLSDTVTAVPPVGAAAEIVTVQLVLPPDATDVGVHVTPVTVVAGGVTVTDAVPELPFNEAVIVTA